MLSIYDFCNLYIEDSEDVEIWDITKEETVFSGTYREAKYSIYNDCEICSFGIENGINVINIETE